MPHAALFHGLNQRLPRARFPRTVATFHDLFVLTSEFSTPAFRARFAAQARDAARRASHIIAVSRFTASQAQELLGVEPARISVVPHGVRLTAPVEDTPREPLILFLGALQKRKNLVRLIHAFEQVPREWRLVLAGGSGFAADEIHQAVADSPRRDAITVTGWIPDTQVRRYLSRASIFAFPSLGEGFGMPVIEAMAWGIPVLTSNSSSLPEVAGEAAILADPNETDSIAAGLARLCGSPSLRQHLATLGRARASQFTWEAAVQRTWEVYQRLL